MTTDALRCPSRDSTPSIHGMPATDEWQHMPDGSRVCSFCGSLHPDDFVDILYGYIEDDSYHVSTTDKGYKIYANRPGVRNAGDGGIKFYTWHLRDLPQAEKDAADAAYRLVIPVYQHRMDERTKRLFS